MNPVLSQVFSADRLVRMMTDPPVLVVISLVALIGVMWKSVFDYLGGRREYRRFQGRLDEVSESLDGLTGRIESIQTENHSQNGLIREIRQELAGARRRRGLFEALDAVVQEQIRFSQRLREISHSSPDRDSRLIRCLYALLQAMKSLVRDLWGHRYSRDHREWIDLQFTSFLTRIESLVQQSLLWPGWRLPEPYGETIGQWIERFLDDSGDGAATADSISIGSGQMDDGLPDCPGNHTETVLVGIFTELTDMITYHYFARNPDKGSRAALREERSGGEADPQEEPHVRHTRRSR